MTKSTDNIMRTRDDEAAYWHARLMSGSMLDQEHEKLSAWLAASGENQAAFDELEYTLDVIDDAGTEALAQEFESELEDLAAENDRHKIRYAAIAATFLLVCAAIVGVTRNSFLPAEAQHYATTIGESDRVNLKDGSVVELNTKTAIAVSYGRDRRDVDLTSGQALFTVERDTKRPFTVATAQADIVVTGTIFDVDAFNGKSTISVISGVVNVQPKAGGSITLLAGDSVAVNAAGIAGAVKRFDANQTIAWRDGKLRYLDAPLETVIEDLNRYFEKPITLAESNLASLPVTGEFDTNDQSAAINGLALSFSLTARDDAEYIILSAGRD